MRYQFQVDGRPAGDVRKSWHDAAHDAVAAGYAVWTDRDAIRLSDEGQIARLQDQPA